MLRLWIARLLRRCLAWLVVEEPAPEPVIPERPGPYLPSPIIDVEFKDRDGTPVGTGSGELAVKIAASGLLIVTREPVQMTSKQHATVHSYSTWFGDVRIDLVLPEDVELFENSDFAVQYTMPMTLSQNNSRSGWLPPPEPPSPEPMKGNSWTKTPISS